MVASATWQAAARGMEDDGMIELATSEPIVLDSVDLAPPDPTLFAPIRLLGAWTSHSEMNQVTRAGHWPDPLTPLRCTVVQPIKDPKAQPVLVIRLKVPVGKAANGRKWSANQAVVVRYHTLDGTAYEAPYGYVTVFPTSPHSDAKKGADLLTHSPSASANSQS